MHVAQWGGTLSLRYYSRALDANYMTDVVFGTVNLHFPTFQNASQTDIL